MLFFQGIIKAGSLLNNSAPFYILSLFTHRFQVPASTASS